MTWYNSTKKYNLSPIGDEPNITDSNDGGDKREIKIECIKFWYNNSQTKNKGDNYTLSNQGVIYFYAKSDKTVAGFTTFTTVTPYITTAQNLTPVIVSNSYDYDGETEKFSAPLTSRIYSIDNIKCSLSGKTSNKNSITYNLGEGIIEISRKV